MATAKKAPPAAAKKVAAPAVKVPAKKTPVAAAVETPVEEPEAEEGFSEGMQLRFLGYGDDVPEAERVLTAGEIYTCVGVTEDEGEGDNFIAGGNPMVTFANPDFNAKKKEHPDTNPKMIEVEVLPEEVEIGEEAEAEAEAEAEEAEAEEAAAPAAKPAAKAAPGAKPAAPAKAAAKAAVPAKGAVKPAKAPAKAAEPEAEAEDEFPELEGEDPSVLAIIDGASEGLIAAAQELEAQVGTAEYQLGGILYHIRKNKEFLEVEGGEAYAEKGGWQKFLSEFFNIDYRKAMYLIEIYVNFTLAGIEDPATRVATIGWTKASKIAKLLNVEGQDPEELIGLAEANSVADLSTTLQEQVQVGATGPVGGETATRVTFKLRLFEEEAKSVEETLKVAQEQLGLADIGAAAAHIILEWASTNSAGGVADAATAPKQKTPAKAALKPAAKRAAVKA